MNEDKRPTGKRYRTMDPLSRVFSNSETAKHIFGTDGFQFFLFQKRWEKIVGPIMAKESYVTGYRNDVLFVNVTNSVFLQQLFMTKQDILQEMAKDEFGCRFHDIRFFGGAPRRQQPVPTSLEPLNEAIKKQRAMYSETLTDNEKNWIQNWTDKHVENDALRPAFSHLMEGALEIRKGELKNGYTPCPLCGTLKPPDQKFCPACTRRMKHARKNGVVLLLKEKPHLTFQEARNLTPCDYFLYQQARDALIHTAKDNIYHRFHAEEEKKFILALLLHKPMDTISQEEADQALSRLPQKKL